MQITTSSSVDSVNKKSPDRSELSLATVLPWLPSLACCIHLPDLRLSRKCHFFRGFLFLSDMGALKRRTLFIVTHQHAAQSAD